jgi:hypothetical protein
MTAFSLCWGVLTTSHLKQALTWSTSSRPTPCFLLLNFWLMWDLAAHQGLSPMVLMWSSQKNSCAVYTAVLFTETEIRLGSHRLCLLKSETSIISFVQKCHWVPFPPFLDHLHLHLFPVNSYGSEVCRACLTRGLAFPFHGFWGLLTWSRWRGVTHKSRAQLLSETICYGLRHLSYKFPSWEGFWD